MKRLIILIRLLTIQVVIFAQTQNLPQTTGDIINLNDTNSEIPQEYIARDKIIFKPGYHFDAATSGHMIARIDESLIFPVDYTPQNQVVNVDNYQIDQSLSVGAITGTPAVSQTGAATYTIPIYTPKGTAGMEPKIALVYNSQSGNGIAGLKFNITGISQISRVPKDFYHDGYIEEVKFDYQDVFALDGNRLIAVESKSQFSKKFDLEIANYNTLSQIAGIYSHCNGNVENIEYFSETTKDKMFIEYGNTADSKLYKPGSNQENEIMGWFINKVTDRFGNYMEYSYDNSNGEIVLKEIKYTGNTMQPILPYNSIQFFYDNQRIDDNSIYFQGVAFRKTKLLKRIKVKSFDKTVRTYEFEYYNDGIFSKLYKIKEYGLNGEEINSTVFNFGSNLNDFDNYQKTMSESSNSLYNFMTGDYNGDGKSEILEAGYEYLYNNNNYLVGIYYTGYKLFSVETGNLLGEYTFPTTPNDYHQIYKTRFNDNYRLRVAPNNKKSLSADFDGDGADDILSVTLKSHDSYYGSYFEVVDFKIYSFSSSTGQFVVSYDINRTSQFKYSYGSDNNVIFKGDFDGDGKMDFITFLSNGNYFGSTIYLSSKNFVGTDLPPNSTENWDPSNMNMVSDKIYVTDFNGNGKQDLTVINSSGNNVYEFAYTPGHPEDMYVKRIFHSNIPNSNDEILGIGDFNGDGNSDFLYNNDPNHMNVAYSQGGSDYNIQPVINNANGYKARVDDFNGDEKSDIVLIKDNPCDIRIFYSNGMHFTEEDTNLAEDNNLFLNFYSDALLLTGDFNGDGNAEVINECFQSNYEIFRFNIAANGLGGNQFVTKITNGFNQKVNFFYRPLTDQTTYNNNQKVYYNCINNDYFNQCFYQFPLYVIWKMQTNNGIAQNNNTTYCSYKGAFYQKQKKSFLGFAETVTSDINAHQQTVQDFSAFHDNNNKFLTFLPVENKTTVIGTNKLISRSKLMYDFKYYDNNKSFYPFVSEQQSWDINLNHSVTNYTVNSDGNITNRHTQINGTEKDINVDYQYLYPYFVQNINKTTTYNSQPLFTESVSYFPFDVNNYGGITVGSKTNNQTGITTHYEDYNNFGLPEKVRISSTAGEPDRISLTEYDDYGRFVTKKTDALGNSEKYVYDNTLGVLTKKTDINNKSTLYQYDNWGRLVKVTSPLSIVSETENHWYAGTDVPNALYYTKTTTTDAPGVYKYYDKLGRLLRTKTESYGQTLLADKQYNGIGQLASKSDPYISGGTPVNTTYEYYPGENRLKKETYQGLATQYIYSGNLTTITDPAGRSFTQTTDALGNIMESDYPMGNTVSFTYGSHGQPVTILADGINTGMNYNATTGYQTQLADVDAGTTDYSNYSGFGELKQQTDARGNTYTNDYDDFGRIEDITGSNGDNIHTEYVASGNGIEQIKNITAQNGTGKHFNYDEFGRITTKTETIDGINYNTAYEYDQYGKKKKETYPGGFAVKYEYNNNGELIAMRRADNNQVIWYCDNYNKAGNPVTVFLGDDGSSLKTDYIYDNFNNISDITTGSSFGMHYEWNNTTGNLTSRTDNIKGFTGIFTYDELDRLLTWQSTGNPSYETHYAINGNITYKSDIATGNLDYDLSQAHALHKVNGQLADFNTNTQHITYTDFNKVDTITQEDPDNNVTHQLTFTYGPDHYRRKTVMTDSNMTTGAETVIYTRYYDGNYEKEINATGTKEFYYISGPVGIIAVYIVTNDSGQLYYTLTDHLGSIVALMDESGTIVEETNYDPWGRVRNSNDWTYANAQPLSLIFRGFTGHEMLPEFGLINMNGRLYDPALGRFLSPDNHVQSPYNPQNYNRYSYCLNNPLIYTDPDGEFFWFPVIIGTAIGAYYGYQVGQAQGATGGDLFGYTFMGGVIGGLSGFIGAGVGGTIASSGFAGASAVGAVAGGAISGTISGGGFAAISGGNVAQAAWHGALAGVAGGFVGGAVGGTPGAFLGGATAGGVGTALSGSTNEQIINNALLGGFLGLGAYELSTFANYKLNYKGNLNYWGYHKASAAFARANFWEAEASWYETTGGKVKGIRYGAPLRGHVSPAAKVPSNTLYQVHTHPRSGIGYQYYGPTDLWLYGNRMAGSYDFRVYGYQNSYTINRITVAGLQGDLTQFGTITSFGYYSNPNTVAAYGTWATQQGITQGTPHGLSLYSHNLFWFGW